MAAWSTRTARATDLPLLLALLGEAYGTAAFPSPEHLTEAVAGGLVRVAEWEGGLLGCVTAEMPSPGHARIWAAAVRPEVRQRGLGARLLSELVGQLLLRPGEPPLVSALAGTDELASARLLLACGFIGTRVLRSAGTDSGPNVYYQYTSRVEYVDPDARHLVPAAAHEQLMASLDPPDHAVTGLVTLGGEAAFEIARFERDDPATLQSGEAAAGIAFSGSVLAAITFLLGFAFSSSRFPDDVRLLLIGATFSTVLSLIIYASASGELARIRSHAFGKIMKWGNVISEYGGVFPFLISLPVTYAQASGNPWATMVLAVALSAAVAWYERSEFSIAHRFRRSRTELCLMGMTAASPTVGAALVVSDTTSWPWSVVLIGTLAARTWLYLFRRGAEADVAERRQWQIRS